MEGGVVCSRQMNNQRVNAMHYAVMSRFTVHVGSGRMMSNLL